MPETVRLYKGKDAEMLIAISTIIESAIANKTFLVSKRPTWVDPFFQNLKTKIDLAVQNYLGADNAKMLRLSTAALFSIEFAALRDLADVKTQVQVDFRNDKPRLKEILNQLGFTTYHKKAQSKDQEALIGLLFQFKTNMISTLQTEITDKGTNLALITAIIGYAATLKNADVTQEGFKGTRKAATAAAIKEFNSCYDAVIGICKISAKQYKGQPEKLSLFSYTKVLKAMNNSPESPPPTVTP
jgi:hypothetical protein